MKACFSVINNQLHTEAEVAVTHESLQHLPKEIPTGSSAAQFTLLLQRCQYLSINPELFHNSGQTF
jgi:SUMO ligase MMS21 Smc5/6 complex component